MADDVQVQFGAQVDQFNEAMSKLVSTVNSAAAGMQTAGANGANAMSAAMATLQTRTAAVTKESASGATAMQAQIMALAGYNNASRAAADSASVFENALGIQAQRARDLREAMSTVAPAMNSTTAAAGGAAHGAAGITREFIVLGHEVVSGNFSRIPGSMMVLAERTGGLLTMISSLSGGTIAAAAAVGAFAIALGVMTEHAISAANAIEATRGEMMIVGTLGESSTGQIQGWIDRLRDHWNASRTEAQKSAEALGSLHGSAAQYSADILEAAAAMHALNPDAEDLSKRIQGLVTAFNGGADGATSFLEKVGVLPPGFKSSGTESERMATILATVKARFVDGGEAVADYTKKLSAYYSLAASMGDGQGSPEDFGASMPNSSGREADPTKGTQQNPDQDQQNAIIRKTNQAYEDQQKTLVSIYQVQQAIDRLTANGDADGAAQAQNAQNELWLKYASIHSATQRKAHEDTLAQLREESSAAEAGSAARIEALRKIAAEEAAYNGSQSASAQGAVSAAIRQGDDKAFQAHIDHLRAQLDADKNNATQAIAIEDQIVAALKQKWGEGSTQYEAELGKRANMVREYGNKATAAAKTADREWYADYSEGIKQQIDAASLNKDEKIRLVNEWISVGKGLYGDDVRNYKTALNEKTTLLKEQGSEAAEIARKNAATQIEIQKINTSAGIGAVPKQQGGGILSSLLGDDEIDALHAKMALLKTQFTEDMAELQASMTMQTTAVGLDDTLNKMAIAQATYAANVKKLQTDAANATKTAWENAAQPINRAFSGAVTGILQGTTTIGQAGQKAAQSLVVSYAEKSQQIATKWIADRLYELVMGKTVEAGKTADVAAGTLARQGLVVAGTTSETAAEAAAVAAKVAAEQAKVAAVAVGQGEQVAAQQVGATEGLLVSAETAIKDIAIKGYQAAAGAYAAIAGIPYVGPVLAPVAAAAALAGVVALGASIASAEGGWDQVPKDGMMTQLHKNEMVLPAKFADPLRQNLLGGKVWGSSSPTGQSGGGGSLSNGGNQSSSNGDLHLHYSPVLPAGSGSNTSGLKTLLRDNASDMRDWLRNEQRNGTFAKGR